MPSKHMKKHDIINGRISLLFFGLLLYAGLLWLIRAARYRYDLIFRPMLIWLLPVCFGLSAIGFTVLLILCSKSKTEKGKKLVDLPFLLALTIPLMAAFLFPWLTLFTKGVQFFRLATELVFYATAGAFAGYIGYTRLKTQAILQATGATLNLLTLYYFYDRFLAPSSFILNTDEFGYMKDWAVALLLIALVTLAHLAGLLFFKKSVRALPAWSLLIPAGLTIAVLAVTAFLQLPLLAVRITVFGTMGLIGLWYPLWCFLKTRKIV